MKQLPTPKNLICIAEITTAHGIRGQVKIRTFTQNPEDILKYGLIQDEQARPVQFKINTLKHPNQLIATITGVVDRNQAEALRGTKLYAAKELLPELREDEYYYDQLVNLQVYNQANKLIGTVNAVHNFGAGDFFDVKLTSREIVTLPFRKESVIEVDLVANKIIADESYVLTNKVKK